MFILRMLLEIVVMIGLCVIAGLVAVKIIFKKKGKKKLSIKKREKLISLLFFKHNSSYFFLDMRLHF